MQVLTGVCPDSGCGKQLYFPSYMTSMVECTGCGQSHNPKHLVNVEPVINPSSAIHSLLQSLLVKVLPETYKKKIDSIKVKGLSNYGCKLISPLLTKYGLDKSNQQVRLLKVMGQGDTFDCSHLADYAFRIEEQKLLISGYGRDLSAEYLKDTLNEIAKVNDNEERLVPIYADGDGHCLLHAVSRALVGHELFWHPLMTNLKDHLSKRRIDYKNLLCDFFEESDWDSIIKEADPNFLPPSGEVFGLRNIHVFGLANLLHRPIILLDSLEGMQSKGDYSAMFVPALIPIEKCRNKDQILHKPIVIAWSSKGRNHFVPLVGIKEKPLPKFPRYLLPKLWGAPQELLTQYIDFYSNSCIIGGEKSLTEQYLTKIATAMEKHFLILNGVAPNVVQDVYQCIIQPNSAIQVTTEMVTEMAREIAKEERLYKCLLCKTLLEESNPCQLSWLEPGGELYKIAEQTHGTLKDGYKYKFPHHNNIVCSYNAARDKLLFVQNFDSLKCKHCKGSLRMLKADGNLVYFDGDQVLTPASRESKCGCGFKHYWSGKEYDNLPKKIPVSLEWNNVAKTDFVYWFQDEPDASLNSNAFEIAQGVVQKHFPGEFGSERLVQKVVDQIFRVTVRDQEDVRDTSSVPETATSIPTKIILTGAKSKTLHKEELNASVNEKLVKKKIEHGAAVKQKRLSSSPLKQLSQGEEHTKKSPDPKSQPEGCGAIKASQSSPKVRISLANSRNSEVLTLSENTSYNDLQSFIEEKFNVEKQSQIIKYSFPPKTLEPPNNTSQPICLKHGERLTVHVKKIPKSDIENAVEMEVDSGKIEPTNIEADSSLIIPSPVENNESDIFASYFSTLFQTMNLWDWACTQRNLFQPDGLFYKQANGDLGVLKNNQHISLPCFPKKIFSYNEQEDELFLCLGETHIPVQQLTAEQLELAENQTSVKNSPETWMHPAQKKLQFRKPDEIHPSTFTPLLHTSFSKSNIVAFSGSGHSMVDENLSKAKQPAVETDNLQGSNVNVQFDGDISISTSQAKVNSEKGLTEGQNEDTSHTDNNVCIENSVENNDITPEIEQQVFDQLLSRTEKETESSEFVNNS